MLQKAHLAHIRLKHPQDITTAISQYEEEYMCELMEKIVEQGGYCQAIEAEADCWSLNELEKYF